MTPLRISRSISYLQLDTTTNDTLPFLLPKPLIRRRIRRKPKHSILARQPRIHALSPQPTLLILTRPRNLKLTNHPQKNRNRIPWQLGPRMLRQFRENLFRGGRVPENEGGATRPAVVVGERDAVDVYFGDVGGEGQEFGYFVCGDVFGFPAEGVADSVDEVEAAFGVLF